MNLELNQEFLPVLKTQGVFCHCMHLHASARASVFQCTSPSRRGPRSCAATKALRRSERLVTSAFRRRRHRWLHSSTPEPRVGSVDDFIIFYCWELCGFAFFSPRLFVIFVGVCLFLFKQLEGELDQHGRTRSMSEPERISVTLAGPSM